MEHEGSAPLRVFDVTRVYVIRRYSLEPGRVYESDSCGRTELVCVEQGTVRAESGERTFNIRQSEGMLHTSAQTYALSTAGQGAALVTTLAFDCSSEYLTRLSEGMLTLDAQERRLIAHTFDEMERMLLGAEQVVCMGIELLLILLLRDVCGEMNTARTHAPDIADEDEEVFKRVTRFMTTNLDKPLRLSDICAYALQPRIALQRIFHERAGTSVIDYFIALRMNAAKNMLRARDHNVTEIAETLGYASIHYFSRSFKRETGMTPSEYASRAQKQ